LFFFVFLVYQCLFGEIKIINGVIKGNSSLVNIKKFMNFGELTKKF